MQRQVRSLNILLVTMLLLLLNTQGAAAHAVVVRAEPADGAVLAGSPGQMTVWLSEAVVPRFSTVQLLDSQNSSISGVSVETDPNDHTVLHIALPDLPDDTYTLFWKVLSDVDGHSIRDLSHLHWSGSSGYTDRCKY
ncbi:MAG: copper resistance protein CopC [Caldilineaceae bacterium]